MRTEFLKQAGDNKIGTFVLLEDGPGRKYVAETGLIGGDFPNHKTVMTVSGDRELKAGANELVVRFESPGKGGVKLVKTYTFKRGALRRGVRHEVINTGTRAGLAAAVPAAGARRQQAAGRVVVLFHLHRPGGLHRSQEIPQGRIQRHREGQGRGRQGRRPTAAWRWCSTTSPAPGSCRTASSASCSCARSTTTCTPSA